MFNSKAAAGFAMFGLIGMPMSASAMTGAGCPDLPEYYRALGTIENGVGSCGDMTLEQAQRIVARGENGQGVVQPVAPVARLPHKHHHRTTHHM